eukprot:CAMPEP_0172522014 /NCGR_PEP_ID=MMETSP1066-20121228/292887_1 /TAXON_ID=671091 /ORGANISM="Coscinodiscus wailesii, Strain CCMP2513" /LENGTH=717 /DNA_ID=CAMNT_0013304979 /DNA_START=53 /DNA_END=2207 /DNA_ORIENTATION=+
MSRTSVQRHICQAIIAILIVSKTAVFGACPHFESLGLTSTASGQRLQGHGQRRVLSEGQGPIRPKPTIYLSQSNFDNGTYRITQPGRYILSQDISFAPNSVNKLSYSRSKVMECCKPRPDQFESNGGDYPDFPYSLGFFAAITVETEDVLIDLAGYTIEQSKEHALMQRFFTVIELASTPFIPGQGPFNFGPEIASGANVRIQNGIIGRSSHHGIHGNGNHNVKIKNVRFQDFEVAALALNGVEGLLVHECTARSRLDVPVMGRFSSGLFAHRFVKALEQEGVATVLTVKGVPKTATDIKTELEDAIVNVYEDIVLNEKMFIDEEMHPKEYALYHNKMGVVDGNAYGFLTNSLGVAVNGFPWVQDDNGNSHNHRSGKFGYENGFPWATDDVHGNQHSRHVTFHSVTIENLQASITEVVSLMRSDNGKPVTDSIGSVLQVHNVHPDNANIPVTVSSLNDAEAVYIGNVVANAQLFVAKCINRNQVPDSIHLPTAGNQINDDIIAWAEASGTENPDQFLANLLSKIAPNPEDSGYYCNGDTMFHVNKGVIGFKIDNTDNAELNKCRVNEIVNHGAPGSTICGEYQRSHPSATLTGYGGANVRGFTFAGSRNVKVRNSSVSSLSSMNGAAVANVRGFTFAGSRNVKVRNSSVSSLSSMNGAAVGFERLTDSEDIKLESCTVDSLHADTGVCKVRFSDIQKDSEFVNEYCHLEVPRMVTMC